MWGQRIGFITSFAALKVPVVCLIISKFQWITFHMSDGKNKPFLSGVGRGSLDYIYIRFGTNEGHTWDFGCNSSLS